MSTNGTIIKIKDLLTYHDKNGFYNGNESYKEVPFYHTTAHNSFVKHILISGALNSNPKECDVFEESLLYFFYGKAEYWPKKDQVLKFGPYPPITLGYNSEDLQNYSIRRIYPFDTGGYFKERYITEMKKEDMGLFEMYPNTESIIQYIKLFFGNLNNYLDLELDLQFNLSDFPLCYCSSLLKTLHGKIDTNNIEEAQFGEQAFTIEIQYLNPKVEVAPEVLFVPEYLFRSSSAFDQLKKAFPNTNEDKLIKYPCRQKWNILKKYISMRETVIKYSRKKIER